MDTAHGRIDPAAWITLTGLAAFVGFLFLLPEPADSERAGSIAPDTRFAIVDATVFDGERFLPHRDVWVEDGRILTVGRRLDLPEDLPRIDGRGHTVLPGLIDGHVHSFNTALEDSLRFGVTTVLDQFTATEIARDARATRTVLAATDQADLYSAGMIATAAGGHGTQFGIEVDPVDGPAEAPAWVRARKAEGSDWIKIAWEDGSAFGMEIASLDRDTVAALIAAAHAEGMRVVVHASRMERALAAIELGADGLVHVWGDALVSEEDAARVADSGAFVISTLSVVSPSAGEAMSAELREAGDPALLSVMQRDTLAARSPFAQAAERRAQGEVADLPLENLRRLHAAGVPIIAGTDAPNPGTGYGLSMHGELRLLVQAGLDAEQALAAATSAPADAFGLEDRGRLDEGRVADLLLVRGDLSQDLSASLDLVSLWKDGFPVVRATATDEVMAADAPDTTLISDFETGLTSAYGVGWATTDDGMMGGRSSAQLAHTGRALRVSGEIRDGFAFPWAGAIWFPGDTAMQPLRFPERELLRFRVRGDGRDYRVMLFSSASGAGAPPSIAFRAGPEWSTVEVALDDFPATDPRTIAALAFVAQGPSGGYALELDDVEIR